MLSKKIKLLRKNANITQAELAKAINVTTSAVGMYEIGTRKPSYTVLKKIADYFKVSIDYFFKETNSNINKIAPKLKTVPKKFTSPDEARAYINQHQIFGSNGFNADNLDDNEILQFANELLRQMEMVSYKYRK